MLYRISDGTLMAGGKLLLQHFDFEIRGAQRIAIVGVNGAGKTTLLRLLHGELDLERDDRRSGPGIQKEGPCRTGFLRQQPFGPEAGEDSRQPGARTGWEYLGSGLSQDFSAFRPDQEELPQQEDQDRVSEPDEETGGSFLTGEWIGRRKKLTRYMQGLSLAEADLAKPVQELSGGQQTKLALVKLLLDEPDILLLDEPTNHLDTESCMWLEEQVCVYPGAVVMVSHDRYFLDETAQLVYELEGGTLTGYSGNYTQYRDEKRKQAAIRLKKYEQEQKEIQRLEGLISRFKNKPRKAAFARSRRKILERMEHMKKPASPPDHIFTGEILPAHAGPKWVIETKKLRPGYDGKGLFELSLRIRRGQKIGIIGPNGAGKTTLFKTLAGFLSPVSGGCLTGEGVETGYFDQMMRLPGLDESAALEEIVKETDAGKEKPLTVLAWFKKQFPHMEEGDARKYLASYLFRGRDTAKDLSMLSGGERARLAIAAILGKKPNFLMLDEPTNHMDIPAKETLESAFQAYKGTILFISHDRYFTEQVADSLLIIEPGRDGEMGEVFYYPFGYRHYMERMKVLKALEGDAGLSHRAEGAFGSISETGQDQKEKKAKETGKKTGRSRGPGERPGMSRLSALVLAEDAALIEGLKKVPEKTRMQARQLTTSEAQYDWELTQARQAFDQAQEELARCEEALESARLREWEIFGAGGEAGASADPACKDRDADIAWLEMQLEQAKEACDRCARAWYDLWQETHPDPEPAQEDRGEN